MTDKEKIRAYIEKLHKEHRGSEGDSIFRRALRTVLFYIDSMQEEHVSEQNLSNVESTGKNWKEPVSDDMWEASKQYALRQVLASTDTEMSEQGYLSLRLFSGFELAVAHKDGANWKKQQMERYRIEHCNSLTNEQAELEETFVSSHVEKNNRIPTFIDAIEYGVEYCKQQMMAKAVDVTITIPYPNGYGGYTQLVDSQEALPFGENIKVLVIKED